MVPTAEISDLFFMNFNSFDYHRINSLIKYWRANNV